MAETHMPPMAQHVHAGGIFFTSHDPGSLVAWFRDALGIPIEGGEDGGMVLLPCGEQGTVLSVQKARPDAPRPPDQAIEPEPYGRQTMMANLRVDDLEAAIERLKAAGSPMAGPQEYPGIGRFAWTRTPDGHDLELWQP